MHYVVYGAEFCPRCEDAEKILKQQGHIVGFIEMEEAIDEEKGWPEQANDKIEVMADHAMRNLELPSIYCVDSGQWVCYDELVEEGVV